MITKTHSISKPQISAFYSFAKNNSNYKDENNKWNNSKNKFNSINSEELDSNLIVHDSLINKLVFKILSNSNNDNTCKLLISLLLSILILFISFLIIIFMLGLFF